MRLSPICTQSKKPSTIFTTAQVVLHKFIFFEVSIPAFSISFLIREFASWAKAINDLSAFSKTPFAMREASNAPVLPFLSRQGVRLEAPSNTPNISFPIKMLSSLSGAEPLSKI